MEIPESYFKIFFQGVYFIHQVIVLESTEEEEIWIEKPTVGLKVNINSN